MRAFALVAGLMIGMVLTGCGRKNPPVAPPPPAPAELSSNDLASIRAEWQKSEPASRVGVIGAVRNDDTGKRWVAVQDINVEGIRSGDVMSVIAVVDGRQNIIAKANVHHVEGKIIVAEYTPVDGAIRNPEKGDLALIIKK